MSASLLLVSKQDLLEHGLQPQLQLQGPHDEQCSDLNIWIQLCRAIFLLAFLHILIGEPPGSGLG